MSKHEAHIAKLQELGSLYRDAFEYFSKSIVLVLTVAGVSIGLIANGALHDEYYFFACAINISLAIIWLIPAFYCLYWNKRIITEIQATHKKLKLKYDEKIYEIFQYIVLASIGGAVLTMVIFFKLLNTSFLPAESLDNNLVILNAIPETQLLPDERMVFIANTRETIVSSVDTSAIINYHIINNSKVGSFRIVGDTIYFLVSDSSSWHKNFLLVGRDKYGNSEKIRFTIRQGER